jgi:aspartyl-tRNA(Asn)/glutamyl-tRNA(Gln) amidotransferase subunit A
MARSDADAQAAPIHLLKAREIASSVLAGALSAREVAAALNARIARLDPLLNAFVDHRPDDVLAEADAVDARIAAGERPPLAGVPFSVKDNLWLGGRPATFGSRLFADFVAPRDSWCVARLRELGAVPLGVTACSEFACKGVTDTPLHGRTVNPWDLARTPGGSSGGAVAAVAAGLGPIALATDAGGSTRRPAAHTGLVGMKPTLGFVPNPWGFDDPNHLLSVIGQVGRDVEDCALMLDALAGFDARDPLSQPVFATAGPGDGLKSRRPAWRVAVSVDLGCGFAIDDDVRAAFDAAIGRLSDAGWLLVQAHPAWPAGGGEYPLLALQQAELAALFGDAWRRDPSPFDPDIAAQIELGTAIAGSRVAEVLMLRDRLSAAYAAFFDRFDLLLTPTAPVEAWHGGRLGPAEIGGRPAGPRGHAAFTPLFNYCGAPAVSIPCGFGRDRLPLGLQIAGPRHSDARVLAAAWQAERVFGLDMRSPMLRAG